MDGASGGDARFGAFAGLELKHIYLSKETMYRSIYPSSGGAADCSKWRYWGRVVAFSGLLALALCDLATSDTRHSERRSQCLSP